MSVQELYKSGNGLRKINNHRIDVYTRRDFLVQIKDRNKDPLQDPDLPKLGDLCDTVPEVSLVQITLVDRISQTEYIVYADYLSPDANLNDMIQSMENIK